MSELVAQGLAGLGVLLVLIGMWAIYRLILSAFTDPPAENTGDKPVPAPELQPEKATRPAEPIPGPAERERLVLLVARHDKVIQSPIAGVYINLGKCFGDLGFLVQRAATHSELESRLESGLPAVMAVDLRLGPRTLHEMARLARRFPALRDCVFLCYNAERPEALTPPALLPHAHFLGLAFASQQVMEILAPAFEFEPATGEAEKDTGAVIEMLGQNRGKFRFFPGKVTRRSEQRLCVTGILMHWAKHVDETGEMAVRTDGEDFRFNSGY